MSQQQTQNSNNTEVRKKLDKMAPIQKGTLKQSQKKLSSMLKTARVAKKKSDK